MDMDIKGHLMFDSGIKYGIKDWWIGTIVLVVINMAITMVAGMAGVAIIGTIGMVLVMYASIGLWVARLRDRGHDEIVAVALRIIIAPWGLIECAFLGSAE
jgi:uncharacterized membrane protein YhaH (DUF805 family)